MIKATESKGVITLQIVTGVYGQAGQHWKSVLNGPNNGGYGKIYIDRKGASTRRRWHTADLHSYYQKVPAINIDECPGAMFIWTTAKMVDVEAVDAIDNQKLGRDMGLALRPFQQTNPKDLWEVRFKFM